MMVAAPAASKLKGPPPSDDRAGGHHFVEDLAVDACRTPHVRVIGAPQGPLVQAVPAVAEAIARALIGPSDESVEGHGHVKNGCRDGLSFPGLQSNETELRF